MHKTFYDFYNTQNVNGFVLSFKTKFSPGDKVKIQGSMKLINYQPTEIIELKSRKVWMTDVCKFFNEFVKGQIKNDLIKRLMINGMSGSSWRFKRFERITMTEAFNEEELNFSGNENDDERSFVNDSEQEDHPVSFYRFVNQTQEFDEFKEASKCSELFLKSLLPFDDDTKDSFFYSVLYGLLFELTENNRVSKYNIEST